MSLTSFISKDLKSKILAGADLPVSLSLNDLSVHYGVSISPVREAVNSLITEGYIDKLPNRRLRINSEMIGTGDTSEPIDYPLIPEDWGEMLLEEVMHESLRKQAVYLREGFLAEKFGVGRSIIRQTFSRFAGAGLLEHIPRRGWLVHPFREQDIEAYLVVREVLELKALDLAKDRIRRDDVEGILDEELHALNNALHHYLIEKSGNRYIRDFFTQYVSRCYTKLFYYAAPEAEVVIEMTGQHRRILEALLAEDWTCAAKVLSIHIRAQREVLKKLLTLDLIVADTG
jgi:DNA-binding GntR family transcriptional regulator